MSEKYDTPVIVRTTTRLSHSQGTVILEEREEVPDKKYERDISKFVMMPAMAKGRAIARTPLMDAPIATSIATFSFGDHSAYISSYFTIFSLISVLGVPGYAAKSY